GCSRPGPPERSPWPSGSSAGSRARVRFRFFRYDEGMRMLVDPRIAFRVHSHDRPALEVRVNFGVFAGRHATPAEIDDLAHALRREVDTFTIVAEDRHEFGGDVEAALHQVVIEVSREHAGAEPDALAERIVARANAWADACIAERRVDV